MCICVCVGVHVCVHPCHGVRVEVKEQTCGCRFSPSTAWILGTELSVSGLVPVPAERLTSPVPTRWLLWMQLLLKAGCCCLLCSRSHLGPCTCQASIPHQATQVWIPVCPPILLVAFLGIELLIHTVFLFYWRKVHTIYDLTILDNN